MATRATRSSTLAKRTITLAGDTLLDVSSVSTSTLVADKNQGSGSRKRLKVHASSSKYLSGRLHSEPTLAEEEGIDEASSRSDLSRSPSPQPPTTSSRLEKASKGKASVELDGSVPAKPKRARKPKIDPTSLEGVEDDVVDVTGFLPRPAAGSSKSHWLVGAHVSAAGGVENAPVNAAELGCSGFALFLKSQRKWSSPPLSPRSIALFKHRMKQLGYDPGTDVLVHGNYLVNLGNPDESKRKVSYECFLDEIKRCGQLGIRLLNIHPGSTVSQTTPQNSCKLIAESINDAHKATAGGVGGDVVVVLEDMAGSGNVIGSTFEEIADIIDNVEDKTRVGVCFDTCHGFSAGYDFRTKEGWDKTMRKFDEVIGLKYLRGFHLNDSKTEFGSKKDRHESIGQGSVGLESFHHILNDPRTKGMPMVLETPSWEKPKEVWGTEIGVLRKLIDLPIDKIGSDAQIVGGSVAVVDAKDTLETLKAEVRDAIKRFGGDATKKGSGGKAKVKATAGKSRKRKRDEEDEDSEGDDDGGCKH